MGRNIEHSHFQYLIDKTKQDIEMYEREQAMLKKRMKEIYGLDDYYSEYINSLNRSKCVSFMLDSLQNRIRRFKKNIYISQKKWNG